MYTSSLDKITEFALIDSPTDSQIEEIHYKGGIKISQNMRDHEKMHGGSSIEKHEYKEYENKVIPISLVYEKPSSQRFNGGINEKEEIKMMPEEIYNKLFYSVANEINSKGNRKTIKNHK
jgi:hypothetical protein